MKILIFRNSLGLHTHRHGAHWLHHLQHHHLHPLFYATPCLMSEITNVGKFVKTIKKKFFCTLALFLGTNLFALNALQLDTYWWYLSQLSLLCQSRRPEVVERKSTWVRLLGHQRCKYLEISP